MNASTNQFQDSAAGDTAADTAVAPSSVPTARRGGQPIMREQDIQIAVVQHLRARGVSGLVFWHTPNGGKRRPVEAAIFKSMGVRAGVSDLILVRLGKIYALELKTKDGRASEAQMEFLSDIDRAGAFTAMPAGLDAALATLEAWGLLRGATQLNAPALPGVTGRHPSKPTEPACRPGAAHAAHSGEGTEAAQIIRPLASGAVAS